MPIGIRFEKVIAVVDPRSVPTCRVVRVSSGFLRKTHIFVHYDGRGWDVLLVRVGGRVEVRRVRLEWREGEGSERHEERL